jgi:hypothetical protein
MRLIFGILVGAVLTVGGAYWHDHFYAPAPGLPGRTLVNWDVAAEVARNTTQIIRSQIARLTEQ